MIIKSIETGPFATNCYLVASNGEAVVIDPSFDSKKWLIETAQAESVKVVAIYLTHSHIDHIADVAEVKETFDCPVWVHKDDKENLEKPGSDGLQTPFEIKGVKADHYFQEGDELHFGKVSFKVIHLPGHSPGSVGLYFEKEKALFSGDVLFHQSIGNLGLPTAEPKKMFKSLDRLAKLPQDVKVYPGHDQATTIGNESWLSEARNHFGYEGE